MVERRGAAIVTGAGSGIGLAVNDLTADKADAVAAIRAASGDAAAIAGKVSQKAEVAAITALAGTLHPRGAGQQRPLCLCGKTA